MVLATGATACGAPADDDSFEIVVTLPAVEYLAARVAGSGAEVTNLLPPGSDPHGQELSPAQVARLGDADLIVYVSGLQPAIDEAIVVAEPSHAVDTLDAAAAELPGGGTPPDPSRDPHFWLDPIRFGIAAEQVAEALADLDPAEAEAYRARADALVGELEVLDAEYRTALAPCAGATLVTSHEAFGYLTARYGLDQLGITGVDPEVEPSPARLREVRAQVIGAGVRTIYFETAADPAVAERLADDLGVATGVLDPMERTAELDYLAVMRTNLAALSAGLVCAP